ncbi:MAG: OmpA family protein, partial [Marinilabiliaceae bacterium]|nr:OmpA family protein [Marinilabiliaceae bacterium]
MILPGKHVLAFLTLFILYHGVSGQESERPDKEYIRLMDEADGFFVYDQDYVSASKIYEELFISDTANYNLAYKLGICYLNIKGSEQKSLKLLRFASQDITPDINYSTTGLSAPQDAIYYLAFACQINMELDEAIANYEKYKKLLTENDVYEIDYINNQIKACKNTLKATEEGIMLKRKLFTDWMEEMYNAVNPVVSLNDSVFVFTCTSPGKNHVFCSQKVDGKWLYPTDITGQLGRHTDMFTNSLTADGKTMVVSRNDGYKGDLYISQFSDGEWGKIKKLDSNINTRYWESHGCITADGNALYFTSNRPGGKGSLDIYYADRISESGFGQAINLGEEINTSLEENTPFFEGESNLLYFSSTGHEGFGGYDIFISRKGKQWSQPLHLPFPLNSTADDLHFFPYQSNSSGLYSVYPDETSTYSTIYYLTHGIEAEIENIGIEGNIILGDGMELNPDSLKIEFFTGLGSESLETVYPDSSGTFSHTMKIKRYSVYLAYPGYKPDTIIIDIPEDFSGSTIKIDRKLTPASVASGKFISVNNILFDFNSTELSDQAKMELNKIIHPLLEFDDMKIEVRGYTDAIGTPEYNLELSRRRANEVADYLISAGINSDRLIKMGLGETGFVAENTNSDGSDNPAGRKYNRRVSLSVRNMGLIIDLSADNFVPRHLRVGHAPGYLVVLKESAQRLDPGYFDTGRLSESILIREDSTANTYRYFVGKFLSKSDAIDFLNSVKKSGFGEAYICLEYELPEIAGTTDKNTAIYTIQLHALLNPDKSKTLNLKGVREFKGNDGFYRYVTGEYHSYSRALNALAG